MNNTIENDFFGFPKVMWLQYTGKVGKCTRYRCQIFSGFYNNKNHQNRLIFDRVIGKIKGGRFFWDTVYM